MTTTLGVIVSAHLRRDRDSAAVFASCADVTLTSRCVCVSQRRRRVSHTWRRGSLDFGASYHIWNSRENSLLPARSIMAALNMTDSESECDFDARLHDSSDEDFEDFICAAIAVEEERKQPKKRSVWVRDWLMRRPQYGAYTQLLQELIREDPKETKRFLRMSFPHFQEILGAVEGRIRKKDTFMRKAISPGERLAMTLRFLGSGDTFVSLTYVFRAADNTIGRIVLETCAAIYEELKDQYLKVPSTRQEWERIAEEFSERWQFPNCVGAIDGKHVQIVSPGRGSSYFNYEHYHSIILLALVDAKYKILWYDVGCNGRAGDAGVFGKSSLAKGLQDNSLDLPPPKPLPGRTESTPHFIVGDDAFGLKPYLMKPFPFKSTIVTSGSSDDPVEIERRKQRIFDYRVSRARRISENVFGILAARFGVFRSAIRLPPEHATTITLACLALHNFLMEKRDPEFAPPTLVDREHPTTHERLDGDWRRNTATCFQQLVRQGGNRNAEDARWVRNEIKEYVNKEGKVPWQEQSAFGQDFETQ